MKINNNAVNKNDNSFRAKNMNLNKCLEIKDIAEYLQKNIRAIISKDAISNTHKISEISSDLISEITLKVERMKNSNNMDVLVFLKDKMNSPEIGFSLIKGSYEDIVSLVDKVDFIEGFTKKIKSMESAMIYGR